MDFTVVSSAGFGMIRLLFKARAGQWTETAGLLWTLVKLRLSQMWLLFARFAEARTVKPDFIKRDDYPEGGLTMTIQVKTISYEKGGTLARQEKKSTEAKAELEKLLATATRIISVTDKEEAGEFVVIGEFPDKAPDAKATSLGLKSPDKKSARKGTPSAAPVDREKEFADARAKILAAHATKIQDLSGRTSK